ncbi:MAG TPA: glycerophosphodiester phosphodiesterase family protein [Oligoflexia bacterium]|nr:glycerophosphodiester phosphodiesterase family protein [Oligoflexia bacterium]HMR25396.1 glycerophosphodiester phosphodiesterase family protein [Oligoflexia bacterium]
MKKSIQTGIRLCVFTSILAVSNALYAKSFCIAHRALHSEGVPENSLEAINEAIGENVQGIEIDIRFTKDKMPIVFHDSRLGKKVQGRGCLADKEQKIADQNWYGAINLCKLSNGEYIPTLPEVVQLLMATNYTGKVFLEFKDLPKNVSSNLTAVKNMMQAMPVPDQLIISSFDEKILQQFTGLGVTLHHIAVQNKAKGTLAPYGYKDNFDGIDFFFPGSDLENSRQQLGHFYDSVEGMTNELGRLGDEQLEDGPKLLKDVWSLGKQAVSWGDEQIKNNLFEAAISNENVRQRLAKGEQVGLWTINDVEQLASFQDMAQDYPNASLYLITDKPQSCD